MRGARGAWKVLQDCANPPSKNKVAFANTILGGRMGPIYAQRIYDGPTPQMEKFAAGARKVQTRPVQACSSVRVYTDAPQVLAATARVTL